jgi:PIN domain nuclease of toxin-antitoxin system
MAVVLNLKMQLHKIIYSLIKKSLGKLHAPDNILALIEKNDFSELSVTFQHAHKTKSLPTIHNDPFDRLLIAQSICERLVLLTADENIKKYK